MVPIHIKMNVRSEKRKELLQTLKSIVPQVRTEKGCVSSDLYHNDENENDILLVEAWETRNELDDHLRSGSFMVLMGARLLLTRPPEVMICAVSEESANLL